MSAKNYKNEIIIIKRVRNFLTTVYTVVQKSATFIFTITLANVDDLNNHTFTDKLRKKLE